MGWSRLLPVCWILGIALGTACDAQPAKKSPKPEHFLGKWVGAWDGKWTVQFTVSRDPESKELIVLYEWEERKGEPLQKSESLAGFEEGVLFVGDSIEITLSPKDANKATAKGNFRKPRVAELVRAKPAKKKKK